MLDSIKKVEANRKDRITYLPQRMTAQEKKDILKKYHPDFREEGFSTIKLGPNKGQKAPLELTELLHSNSRLIGQNIDLTKIDHDIDVLVIGGGGAGCAAAIEAKKAGSRVIISTKLRIGDSNTVMAEGGIQAANKENDSPKQHYLDTFGGGHFEAKPELLKRLVLDGPLAIAWLNELGVMFDKAEDGTMVTTHGGGTSRKRMHACKDVTGAEISRVLKDEVKNLSIPVLEYTSAIELILDDNSLVAGAVLYNAIIGKYFIVKAKSVIIATGGSGRMHYNGFPTSNHYGATGDGLVIAYRAGAPLKNQDSIQYHPTGTAFPPQIYGALITEKTRAIGAMMINIDAEVFCHPLETRDVASSAIIREIKDRNKGITLSTGVKGVWLDTPMIDLIHGDGFLENRIPGQMHMFSNYGIDMRKVPVLIYPTFHYQNGGIEVEPDSNSPNLPNLFIAGEAAGGIHGRNRLMGNSLLDIIVFGRISGKNAAKFSAKHSVGNLSLKHINEYKETLKTLSLETGITSPILYPSYARNVNDRKLVQTA